MWTKYSGIVRRCVKSDRPSENTRTTTHHNILHRSLWLAVDSSTRPFNFIIRWRSLKEPGKLTITRLSINMGKPLVDTGKKRRLHILEDLPGALPGSVGATGISIGNACAVRSRVADLCPAPGTITQLIKCGCKKSRCASHCSCRLNNLNCSELCMCGADEEVCANVRKELLGIDENEDEDSAM